MEHQAEQAQEMETLAYIYTPDELQITENDISITMTLDNDDEFILHFTLPPAYPDIPPIISLQTNLNPEDEIVLLEGCMEQAVGSLGMCSLYTIASYAKETAEELIIARIQFEDDAEDARKLKQEEEEAERYKGTRVNAETFNVWKIAFLAEAEAAAKSGQMTPAFKACLAVEKMENKYVDAKGGKLTGRLLFEGNDTLVQSDAAIDEGEDVDISMFDLMAVEDEEEENLVLLNFDEND